MLEKEKNEKTAYSFSDLLDIMRILRSDNGCPWDRAQDHKSIRNNLIEETYEVIEGIDKSDNIILREELGDLLLQVVFHARIAEEDGAFNIDDVITDICKKLIRRHPHIFKDSTADNPEQAVDNWEEIKKEEKHIGSLYEQLSSVPHMPSLLRAAKISKKIKKSGAEYCYSDITWDRIKEVENRLSEMEPDSPDYSVLLGEYLYMITVLNQSEGVDCEESLDKTVNGIIESTH